jgi:hypothetical protein
MKFCPNLQLDWQVKSIDYQGLPFIKVTLCETTKEEPPSIVGRHFTDINSYPGLFQEKNITEFIFSNCIHFDITRTAITSNDENEKRDGKTFQRLEESELLKTFIYQSGDDSIIHYRIITTEEVIEIICYDSPQIIKKN